MNVNLIYSGKRLYQYNEDDTTFDSNFEKFKNRGTHSRSIQCLTLPSKTWLSRTNRTNNNLNSCSVHQLNLTTSYKFLEILGKNFIYSTI